MATACSTTARSSPIGSPLPAGAVWHKGSLYVASPPDVLRFDGATGNKEVLVHRLEDVRQRGQSTWTVFSARMACCT